MIPGFWQHALAVEWWRRPLEQHGFRVVLEAIELAPAARAA